MIKLIEVFIKSEWALKIYLKLWVILLELMQIYFDNREYLKNIILVRLLSLGP